MKVHELIDRLSKLNPDGMIVALDEWGYYHLKRDERKRCETCP